VKKEIVNDKSEEEGEKKEKKKKKKKKSYPAVPVFTRGALRSIPGRLLASNALRIHTYIIHTSNEHHINSK
jgi:hypothetical protein